MDNEIRITIELLDSKVVKAPIAKTELLIGIEDGIDAELEGGGLGDIEHALDCMLADLGEAREEA